MPSNGNQNFCWIEQISDEIRPTYRILELMCPSIKDDNDCYEIESIVAKGIPSKAVRDYSDEDVVDKLLENSGEVKIINELDST